MYILWTRFCGVDNEGDVQVVAVMVMVMIMTTKINAADDNDVMMIIIHGSDDK